MANPEKRGLHLPPPHLPKIYIGAIDEPESPSPMIHTAFEQELLTDLALVETVSEYHWIFSVTGLLPKAFEPLNRPPRKGAPRFVNRLQKEGEYHTHYRYTQAEYTDEAIYYGHAIAAYKQTHDVLKPCKISAKQRRRAINSIGILTAPAMVVELNGYSIGDILTSTDNRIRERAAQWWPGYVEAMKQANTPLEDHDQTDDNSTPLVTIDDTPLATNTQLMKHAHDEFLTMTASLSLWNTFTPIQDILERDAQVLVMEAQSDTPVIQTNLIFKQLRAFSTACRRYRRFIQEGASALFDPTHPGHAQVADAVRQIDAEEFFDEFIIMIAGGHELMGSERLAHNMNQLRTYLAEHPEEAEDPLYTEMTSTLDSFVELNKWINLDYSGIPEDSDEQPSPEITEPRQQYIYPATKPAAQPVEPTGRKRKHHAHTLQETEQLEQAAEWIEQANRAITPVDTDSVIEGLTDMSSGEREQILKKLQQYETGGAGMRKLQDAGAFFRFRVGKTRIIFELTDGMLTFHSVQMRDDTTYDRLRKRGTL